MRKRQIFVITCLFGVAGVIVLSLNRSHSVSFTPQLKPLQTDGHPDWIQNTRPVNHEKLNMVISDVHNSTNVFDHKDKKNMEVSRCPDILSGMTKGKWIKRSLTQQEQAAITDYLKKERMFYRIPATYQREDGRCGDVAYKMSPQYPHMLFKAICNAKGDTPCCYTNRCINASEADCRCPTCYDERQSIHAEYAQWETEDDLCAVKNFTSLDACTVLNGTTLHFVGDSFIRHVFVAMVIILTNNPQGAVRENTPENILDHCKGMHQLTFSLCRDYLDMNRSLCGGTVKVVYTQVFPAKHFSLALPSLQELSNTKKSLIVLGLGIHDNFNVENVSQQFLLPLFNHHQSLARNNISKVNLVNTQPTLGNMGASTLVFDIPNTTFDNTLYRTLLPFDMNHTQGNVSFGHNFNQLKSDLSFLDETTTKNVFSATSPSDMDKNQQPAQQNHLKAANMFINNLKVSNSQEKKQYTGVGRLTNTPYPVNLDFRRSHNVNLDDLDPLNVSRAKRNSETGNSSPPIISQTSQSSADKMSWPRILWIGAHSPGLMKSPTFSEQTAAGVQSFNKNIYEILNDFKVPHLDTFEFTKGIVSFDGTHYGWGINMLKANMLLTYIQHELTTDPDWR